MYVAKFFEKKMDFDRARFQNELNEAIDVIAKNRSVVAKRVLKTIKENRVCIRSFYDLSKAHYLSIKKMLEKHEVFLSSNFPPTPTAVLLIENQINGCFFYKNYIYLKSGRRVEDIAGTLVHEVSHYFYRSVPLEKRTRYLPHSQYNDEVIAFTAQKLFNKNGQCLLRKDVKEIHSIVIEHYPHIDIKDKPLQASYVSGYYDDWKSWQECMEQDHFELKKTTPDYGGLTCSIF